MTVTRVNGSSISGSGTTASAYNVTGSPALLAGDVIVITVDSNGTHAANGMSVTLAGETFATIAETQQGGASARWIQTFSCTLVNGQTPTPSVTPYASNTASTAVMDVYRGLTGAISRAAQVTSGASGASAANPALLTAPPAGDLVLTLTGVSSGTATQPAAFTLGSQSSAGGPTVSNAHVLSADGVSTYGGTWTWGTTNSSALQTVAFAASAGGGGGGVASPVFAANPGQTWKRQFKNRQILPRPQSAGVGGGGGGPVTFDTFTTKTGGAVSTINWLHVCTGANVLLVDVAVGNNPDTRTVGVTYNGVTMTSLLKRHSEDATTGFLERFALAAPAAGSNSIVVTLTGGTATSIVGGSMSFIGADQTLGNYVTTSAVSPGGGNTAMSVTAIAPATGTFVMGGFGAGNAISSVSTTSRYNVAFSSATSCGNLAGNTAPGAGINVTLTGTVSAIDSWVAFATIIPAAAGGTNNFTQPLNATLGFTSSDTVLTNKTQSATLSFTGSQTRRTAKILGAATVSFTGSIATLAVHHFTQALNATLSFTSSQTRAVRTNLAGTLSFTGSQSRQIGKGLAATLSFTGSLPRRISTNLAGALSFTGSVTKRTATTVANATLAFTGSVASAAVHHFTQALNATLSFTGAQSRAVRTNLSGALSFTGSLPRRTSKGLAATVSFTGSLPRRTSTNLAATLSFTGNVTKRTAKNLGTATVSFTGSVTTAAVHFFTQALNATLSFTGSQNRSINKTLAATVSFTGSITKRVAKGLAGALSFTSSQTRRTATNLAGTLSFTGSQTRRVNKTLSATASFTGSVATQTVHFFIQALNATLSFTGSVTTRRTIVKALSASLSFTGSQTKRTAKTLAAGLSYTGNLTKRIAKTISAALGFTGLLDLLSSAQPRSGTASAAQMTVPDSTPGSVTAPSASAADGVVPVALRGSGTAPTSEAGNASGPTSSAP